MNAPSEFVDTNVLLYALDSRSPKYPRARALLENLSAQGRGCLSVQVLQELYVNLVRKLGVAPEAALDVVASFSAWPSFSPAAADVLEAARLHQRHQVSFWDAMIVHAASRLGCAVLWSEDLNDTQVVEGVRVRNPFA